jgi:N-acetylglucosamine-6-phosphate deacetylase
MMDAMVQPTSAAAFMIATPQLFDGAAMRGPACVSIAGAVIESIRFGDKSSDVALTLPAGAILAPGFIDVQVNGGGGVLLNDDPTPSGIRKIVEAHRRAGTTGCLPTLITDRTDVIERLANAAPESLQIPGVLGFHLEGPAINKARKGIHLDAEIRVPSARDLAAMKRFGACGRSVVTLAPETVPSSLIDELISCGLRVSVGHSDASAAQVRQAADQGVTGVTHLFNAMSQLTARAPGVVGAALDDNSLFAGIICDGLHVDPIGLRLAFARKGRDRLMLVSDAMPSVGTDQTEFVLQGRKISRHGDRLISADGTLAGAHLTMAHAVRNAVNLVGVDLADALVMASRAPATFLGLQSELGSIAPGYRADLVALDSKLDVIESWLAGRPTLGASSA